MNIPISVVALALLQGLLLQRAVAADVSCQAWLGANNWSSPADVPQAVTTICRSRLSLTPRTTTSTSYYPVATRTITTASYSTRTSLLQPVVTKVKTLLENVVATQIPAIKTITVSESNHAMRARAPLPTCFSGMDKSTINSACACLGLQPSLVVAQARVGQTLTATVTLPRTLSTIIARPTSTLSLTLTKLNPKTYLAKQPYFTITIPFSKAPSSSTRLSSTMIISSIRSSSTATVLSTQSSSSAIISSAQFSSAAVTSSSQSVSTTIVSPTQSSSAAIVSSAQSSDAAVTSSIRSSGTAVSTSSTQPKASGTVNMPARVLAYGDFNYMGCYVEPNGGRVLSRNLASNSSMTVETCLTLAREAGLDYAGLEYGAECWAGAKGPASTIAIAPDSECNMLCAGDRTSYCGNGNRLQVYKSSVHYGPALPQEAGQYIYDGCYVDSVDHRVMSRQISASSNMTVPMCAAQGAGSSYSYIGLEYGAECFVSNNPSGSQLVQDEECSKACGGDAQTTCGEANRLQVYRLRSAPSIRDRIYLEREAGQYVYDGCYVDSVDRRVMDRQISAGSNMTVPMCTSQGAASSYSYVGLEYGAECYASNAPLDTQLVKDEECSKACGGNAKTTCGEANRLQVYRLSSATSIRDRPKPVRFKRDVW